MGKYDDYDWEELPANIKAAGKLLTFEYAYMHPRYHYICPIFALM